MARGGPPGRRRLRAGLRRPLRVARRRAMRRAMRRAGVALVVAAAVPLLAACAKTPAGSTTTRSVAWVTTSASVTLPGKGITPVDLPKGRAGQQVVLGSLPSALAYTAGDTGLLVVTQGD